MQSRTLPPPSPEYVLALSSMQALASTAERRNVKRAARIAAYREGNADEEASNVSALPVARSAQSGTRLTAAATASLPEAREASGARASRP